MTRAPITLACACALALPVPALAGAAHEHGLARLDMAVEAGRVTLEFETPLDNLLGFERAPRSAAERRAADAVLSTLKNAESLFRFDPAARCRAAGVELESAALGVGNATARPGDEHAELHASWSFDCPGGVPGHFEQGLFDAFKRLARIEVQLVTPGRQAKVRLDRPQRRVELPR